MASLRGEEGVRLYYAAQQRLFRARKKGAITEEDFRARQRAIVDWLGERHIYTTVPNDSVLARGDTVTVYSLDPDAD